MTAVFIKWENLDTETRPPHTGTRCEDEGGDQGGASTRQGTARTVSKCKVSEVTGTFSCYCLVTPVLNSPDPISPCQKDNRLPLCHQTRAIIFTPLEALVD